MLVYGFDRFIFRLLPTPEETNHRDTDRKPGNKRQSDWGEQDTPTIEGLLAERPRLPARLVRRPSVSVFDRHLWIGLLALFQFLFCGPPRLANGLAHYDTTRFRVHSTPAAATTAKFHVVGQLGSPSYRSWYELDSNPGRATIRANGVASRLKTVTPVKDIHDALTRILLTSRTSAAISAPSRNANRTDSASAAGLMSNRPPSTASPVPDGFELGPVAELLLLSTQCEM